jgi:hypothetical protein
MSGSGKGAFKKIVWADSSRVIAEVHAELGPRRPRRGFWSSPAKVLGLTGVGKLPDQSDCRAHACSLAGSKLSAQIPSSSRPAINRVLVERAPTMREIREQKELSIVELSILSGIPEDILAQAESGKLELGGKDLKDVQKVYWNLSALEATPADCRRLLAEMEVKANEIQSSP